MSERQGKIFLSCGHQLTDDMRWADEEGLHDFVTKDYSYDFGPNGEALTYHAVSYGSYCLDCQSRWPRDGILIGEAEEDAWMASSPALTPPSQ